MDRHATEETLNDHVKNLTEAYDCLIATLYWERGRLLSWAEELAEAHGDEVAKRVIAARAAYIREQAIR